MTFDSIEKDGRRSCAQHTLCLLIRAVISRREFTDKHFLVEVGIDYTTGMLEEFAKFERPLR